MNPRDVPILILGFNRPDLIKGLLDELRGLQPRTLFYAVDGPRPGTSDDSKVLECRDLVSLIDWPCSIQTRFLESNLGCGKAVSSAITWFFDHVEEGIILEDDIRPDPTFFPFVTTMLERFRYDPRVFAINGTNFIPPDFISTPGSYRFSQVPVVWGWATWRRSWRDYQFNLETWWSEYGFRHALRTRGTSFPSLILWSLNFALVKHHQIDTWDLQLVHAAMESGRLTVTPNVNLVANVGFGSDATHTRRQPRYILERQSQDGPLMSRPSVLVDERADKYLMKSVYGASLGGLATSATKYLWSVARERFLSPTQG